MQGAARAFQNAGARSDQVGQSAVLCEHIVNLLGTRGDRKADIRMDGFALQDGSDAHQIQVGGVCAGTDADLIDLDCADLVHCLDVVRAVRASGQRDQLGEVDGDFFVIDRIRVGGELHPILLAALCLQEGAGDLVGRGKWMW